MDNLSLRRLEVFRKNGFFGNDTRGAKVRRAVSAQDYYNVFKLVHDTYIECGWVRPQPSGLRIRPWDLCPTTAVFIAEFNDTVVGSLIVVGDTPDLSLPIDIAFSDITDSLRGPGRALAEMGVQIVAPAFRRGSVLTELQRCAYAHLAYTGYTDLLTIVTPVQRHFMEMINLHTMTEPRRWDPALDDLVVLVGADRLSFEQRVAGPEAVLDELDDFRRRFLITENPYSERVAGWDAQAQHLFGEPKELLDVASKCYELWRCAKPHELRAMVRYLGADPTVTMDLKKSA